MTFQRLWKRLVKRGEIWFLLAYFVLLFFLVSYLQSIPNPFIK